MPRPKYSILPSMYREVDCFAFRGEYGGKPDCIALKELYCLCEDKPCPHKATPSEAAEARRKSDQRLKELGSYEELRKIYALPDNKKARCGNE